MRASALQPILKGVTALGAGQAMEVENYDHVSFVLASSGSASFTVKVQGSYQDAVPSWGTARSVTNLWDYVQVREMQGDTPIDGDTGIVFAADDVQQFEVNTFGMRWVNVIVTVYSQGTIYAYGKAFKISEAS